MSKLENKLRKMIENDMPSYLTLPDVGKRYINKKMLEELRVAAEAKIKSGGVLPILPILLGILGAAGSAAGVAGGIATTVSKAKEAQKMNVEKQIAEENLRKLKEDRTSSAASTDNTDKNKNDQTTSAATADLGDGIYLHPFKEEQTKSAAFAENENGGNGIFLNKLEGNGFYKFIKSKDKCFGKKFVKNFKNNEIKVEKQGDGLFLFPLK